nr:TRAP transporter small permease [Fredinandcohnia onubensis]
MGKKILDYFLRTTVGISNILLVALTLVVTLEVISRKLFNHSFTFVSAFTGLVFPWLVFLAIIAVTKNNDHIGVSFFFDKLTGNTKKFVMIFNKVVMLAFSLLMLKSSYELTESVVDVLLPIIEISRAWLYVSMVIAFLGSTVVIIIQIFEIIKNKTVYGVDENNDFGHGV